MIGPLRRALGTAGGVLAVLAGGLLAGCSGGGGAAHGVLPSGPLPSKAAPVAVMFRVHVGPPAASPGAVTPKYINPTATESMMVRVYSNQPFNGQVYETVIQNLTPATSSYCTTDATGTNCMFPLNLPPGKYVATVLTYMGQNGHGTVLSIQYNVFFTVPPGGNGNPTVIPWTLYGVPESLSVVPVINSQFIATGPNTVSLYSGAPVQLMLGAFDAAGAQIVGSGSPAWTVTSSNPTFTVTPPAPQNPNTLTVTPPASNAPSTTQLTVNATYPPDQTRTISSPCRQPKAVCTIATTINFRNVASDDWTTFAHDQLRSGQQQQSTGISASNVATLASRWKVALPSTFKNIIDASPVVYNGNVIVVTNGGHVYDLSAIDGSILWSQYVGGIGVEVIAAPTIDPASNLVFIANRVFSTGGAQPSYLYALNLKDGTVAWKAQVPGLTHAGPVVANGVVYQGTSGGDPPQCLDTGVTALNELNGSPEPTFAHGGTWYVNSNPDGSPYPNGGGSVWSVMAFDGSHLIFGTGNTCQTPVTTSNGAVALDLNGNVVWNFVAVANSSSDYDTGGGVMISGGNATFLNKNGILYTLSAATGSVVRETVVNAFTGYGYFATPTTDSATTLIGAGMFYCHPPHTCPSSSAIRNTATRPEVVAIPRKVCILRHVKGAHPLESINGWVSFLRAVDSSGNILWSKQMNNGIEAYAALHNGLTFLGLDQSVAALDMHTGQLLWSAPASGLVVGGPVVVPSGVYAVDESANVYAYSLPYASGSASQRRLRRRHDG